MANMDLRHFSYIGKKLIHSGKLTEFQLQEALSEIPSKQVHLFDYIVNQHWMTESDLCQELAKCFNAETIDLSQVIVNPMALVHMSRDNALKYSAFPFKVEGSILHVAMRDPGDFLALDELRMATKKRIKSYVAPRAQIERYIDRHIKKQSDERTLEMIKEEFGGVELLLDESNLDALSNDQVENAPIVKLATSILTMAIELRASDIHIEPFEKKGLVRYRVDGVLVEKMQIPKNAYTPLSTRLKIISGMDIAEKRIPQDGRIEMKINNLPYDFRVSSLPTVFGEKIVLRLLDRTGSVMKRGQLGFTDHENELLDKILKMPNGIMLVTGPTGSGKTTTLYSFLSEINEPGKNILTIEDPVEYMLEGINQVQVNSKTGLTFAAGLRSMLRQDPDIIMLGEIRDQETASIAIRASITGHFVLSTIHTNDAISTVSRLMDMGIESYLVGDAVKGIIAQRLIRRICKNCREEIETDSNDMELLKIDSPKRIYRAKGCPQCNQTGYSGRIPVHEVLYIEQGLKNAIEKGAKVEELKEIASKEGFTSMYVNARDLVFDGHTTVKEMVKVINES